MNTKKISKYIYTIDLLAFLSYKEFDNQIEAINQKEQGNFELRQDSICKQEQEELSVIETYTIIQPWAMMVHIQYTPIASRAMMASFGFENVADKAVSSSFVIRIIQKESLRTK